MPQPQKIAFQGVSGAYSEQAVVEFGEKYGISFELQGLHSFKEVFDEVLKGESVAMVPVENSVAGSVVRTYDLLYTHDVEVIGEWKVSIEHALIGVPDTTLESIKSVISHPQALSQCSEFIEESKFETLPFFDTAGSVKEIAEKNDPTVGAIASAFAAEKYKMKILKSDIQNRKSNTTRFFLIKKKGTDFDFEEKLGESNKTSVIFETKDIPAVLYKSLAGFATNNVNLLKLESHPHPEKEFDYLFYLDFEGNLKDDAVARAMDELNYVSENIKILGSYTRKE